MGKLVNKKELAQIVGITERTLTEYQKAGMPMVSDGGRGSANQYDTGEVIKWLVERAINGKQESARERLDRIRADREEINFAKDIEELVPASPLAELLERVALGIRSTMLNGNSKLKTEIDTLYDIDLDISLLHEHSRTILTHLSEISGEHVSGGGEGSESISATSEGFHH